MRVVHESDGKSQPLAENVETADSFLSQARGLMFRRSIPDDYALAFRFDDAASRDVHMVFVPFALDVIWTYGGEVQQVERLSAWTGLAKANTLFELPAGRASDVTVGDSVRLVE
ncbi:DUF192 domain-containing protein [Haladaptatus pallidirubidus]|uniref:DUF192 domain-containing protein n=1 Tax=Haladaptatus pallidirubidus TaxID=1008152 RepID=A0AAV3UKR7_9EURY|nr:DUF192 domain-containing protein [Haladaptatus pallidirubidus]